jgi:short-subunit dehydrogenase
MAVEHRKGAKVRSLGQLGLRADGLAGAAATASAGSAASAGAAADLSVADLAGSADLSVADLAASTAATGSADLSVADRSRLVSNPRSHRPGLPLAGAACLLTGASGGIGAATACRLADAGARVALHGRDRDALERLAMRTGGVVVVADLCDAGAAEMAVAKAEASLGRPLDLVVSNAGAGWCGDFLSMEPDDIDRILALNLTAPVHLARAVLPGMVVRGRGHLVLVGSIAGHLGVGQEAVYSAAKAGLVTLAEALRAEVAPAGVGVSLVSPGVVATGFFDHRGHPYGRRHPQPIPPERVAWAVEQAVVRGRARVIVPAWLGAPVALAAVLPGLYRRLSYRWG